MRTLDEHRTLVEEHIGRLPFAGELAGLAEAMRYALQGGGKRIRPVLCLATGEAAGAEPAELLPAAAAVELVHTFSLVHDDLPALDDDALRRGRASAHVEYGEAVAILAGDALLAQALDLALAYGRSEVARELTQATLGMLGGQYLDVTDGTVELAQLHALKTGRLFSAAVGSALWVAEVPERDQEPWRAFAADFGLLFQIVDDLLDDDGIVHEHGEAAARALSDETEESARAKLAEIPADTARLDELVSGLSMRARAS
ncbi:MAG: polyprenyl synthetase family protein [Actinobacteria bacterium]|nr:polyprenyl synthetase family protein [Actinomycetota bacterium]